MDLFKEVADNLLPYDGTVLYYGNILSRQDADQYFQRLMETIEWRNDEAVIFGKHFITKRKVAWYANKNYSYTYSNTTRQALLWTPELLALKNMVEDITQTPFNSCLLNLYHDGDEGMGWHSDDEKTLGKDSSIASLSFGAERVFNMKHRVTKAKISIVLHHGSLLVMKGTTQSYWLHSIPKSKKIRTPRVNLTFRWMIG